jgi:signal transduction histidine kinase/CHASE2 domain-containing sensor protein
MKKFWQMADPKRTFSVRRWLRLTLLLMVLTGLITLGPPPSSSLSANSMSQKVGDFYFRWRSAQPSSKNVALVLIDDSAIAAYGRWPWPRKQLAQLIGAVARIHPKTIGVDVLLSEPEDEANDSALEAAIAQARNVVLPTKISGQPSARLWLDPLPRFSRAAAAVGHVESVVDPDGLCRGILLEEAIAAGKRPAFAVAVAKVAGAAPPNVLTTEAAAPSEQIPGVERLEGRYLMINYRQQFDASESTAPFLTLSARDLLKGQKQPALQGKIVLIGFGSTDLSDRMFTPVSNHANAMPGVEVNANAVDTILEHKQIVMLGEGTQLLLLVAGSMLSLAIVMWWPSGRGLLYLSVLLLAAGAAGYLFFAFFNRQLLYSPFLVAGILAAPLAQLENLIVIDRAITRRLKELQKFLPSSAQLSSRALFLPAQGAPPSHLHWKLRSLRQLEDELASLYAFDETLLETMQEALAVYTLEGNLLFHNSSWRRFCEKQGFGAALELDDLGLALGLRGEFSALLLQPEAWQEKELSLKEGLWRLRAIRLPWPNPASSNAMMLLLEDVSARRQRDQARAEALGFVTHELRTPLMAIQGYAEFLMQYPETSTASEAPATIFREARRLVAMINAYLEVLRMDVGARPLRLKPVAIGDMVNHVRQILQPLAQAAHMQIKVETDPAAQLLSCDGALITGALLNLVSNAVKYSPNGSTISVHTTMKDSEVEFAVHNRGPAIPAQDLQHLFEPYYRASQHADSRPGWGLGLAFVKRISEQHGGRVEVTSDESAGTCFRMVLPVSLPVASEVVL